MTELIFDEEFDSTESPLQKDIYGIELDEKEYHSSNATGSTMLSTIIENPIKYEMIKKGLMKLESIAFENGTILHTQVLQPELSDEVFTVSNLKIPRVVAKIQKDNLEYISIPEEFLTTEGSISKKTINEYEEWESNQGDKVLVSNKDIQVLDFLEENKDKIIINSERLSALEVAITNAETYLPNFEKYFKNENGYSERSFFAILYADDKEDLMLNYDDLMNMEDRDARLENGILCQCRPDRIYVPNTDKPRDIIVFDFKSTGKSASSLDWVKSSASFGYDLQEVHYTRVLVANGFNVLDFCFAYCSLLEYGGAGYKAHQPADIEKATELHDAALLKLKWCEDNDTYSIQTFTSQPDENGEMKGGFDLIDRPPLPIWRNYATA